VLLWPVEYFHNMHPIVFQKQAEYFAELAVVLDEINVFISLFEILAEEKRKKAKGRPKRAAGDNACIWELSKLHDKYFVFLPLKLIQIAHELHMECLQLSAYPSIGLAEDCIHSFFKFKEGLRRFIGIDSLAWKCRIK